MYQTINSAFVARTVVRFDNNVDKATSGGWPIFATQVLILSRREVQP